MADSPRHDFACLAVEAASQVCSVSACREGRIATRSGSAPREQSRRIFVSVHEVLEELDMRLDDLDCIAFGCGPGGFTGLRVGAAAVQALAYGASIPVCRISSLACMALDPVERDGATLVAACLDARMGEAYLGIYAADDELLLSTVLDDCLVDPATFAIDSGLSFFAAGPGWGVYSNLLKRHEDQVSARDFESLPTARQLLCLAEKRFRSGETNLPGEALPNYIRDKVTG